MSSNAKEVNPEAVWVHNLAEAHAVLQGHLTEAMAHLSDWAEQFEGADDLALSLVHAMNYCRSIGIYRQRAADSLPSLEVTEESPRSLSPFSRISGRMSSHVHYT